MYVYVCLLVYFSTLVAHKTSYILHIYCFIYLIVEKLLCSSITNYSSERNIVYVKFGDKCTINIFKNKRSVYLRMSARESN